MQKENKEFQICGGKGVGGVKTGVKRNRLRKCDIGKTKRKKFFILRALQVIWEWPRKGEAQTSGEKKYNEEEFDQSLVSVREFPKSFR